MIFAGLWFVSLPVGVSRLVVRSVWLGALLSLVLLFLLP